MELLGEDLKIKQKRQIVAKRQQPHYSVGI